MGNLKQLTPKVGKSLPTRPTKFYLKEALWNWFGVAGDIKFPITCKCGEEIKTFAGVAIHLKRVHGAYVKRRPSLLENKLRLLED